MYPQPESVSHPRESRRSTAAETFRKPGLAEIAQGTPARRPLRSCFIAIVVTAFINSTNCIRSSLPDSR